MLTRKMDKLFSPFIIKNIELRNRFVMPAMQRGFVKDCTPTDAMIEYLRLRGKGGVGLIISESCSPDHPSAYWQDIFCFLSDDRLAQWQKLVVAIKETGAHYFLQIWHPGALREVAAGSPFADYPTLSPSGLIQENRRKGRAATIEELEEIKGAYVRAGRAAQQIGADGIEIHSCHGYFLDQFLWQETNRRTDHYGGSSLRERAQFPAEIVAAIRKAVGQDFIISFRFSQFKEVDYGARIAESPEDLRGLLEVIRGAGADCFNVSSRRFHKAEWPDLHPSLGIAGWTKSMTDATVISVGSVGLDSDMFEDLFDHQDPQPRVVNDLDEVVKRLEADEFDLIGVGRAHIANSDFVQKVREGRFGEIKVFKKSEHLNEFVDGWEVGAVEEFRKISGEA